MKVETEFLKILNGFLNSEKKSPELGPLSPENVQVLLSMGMMHSVYPIVLDALRTTKGYAELPEPEQDKYRNQAKMLVLNQTVRTALFLQVYSKLIRAGVTPLVVKGIVLRNLYRQPDYRLSSDEDLLIAPEDFPRIDRALQEMGFRREHAEHPERMHEVTFHHPENGLHLEIHMSLFPMDSQAFSRLNGEFSQIFARRTEVEIQGVQIATLDPTQHMLYLICHGLKHFLHSGFGIRQLCDMVVFARAYGKKIDWEQIKESARRQYFYVFWMNLFEIGQRYLGFSWEEAGLTPPDDVQLDSQALLADLLDSGIYGKSSEQRLHSANMTLEAVSTGGKKNLRSAIFPDRAYMSRTYPWVEKHGWLLPAAWAGRALHYLSRSRGREISQTVSTGKHRVDLLKQYGIIPEKSR